MAENGELDASAGPTGVSVRTKGYRLMDLAWGGSVIGIAYLAVLVTFHDANASKESATVAEALKISNKQVADALKEQNQYSKEQSKETNQILREMARATRENNCLMATPESRRPVMADVCKRISQ